MPEEEAIMQNMLALKRYSQFVADIAGTNFWSACIFLASSGADHSFFLEQVQQPYTLQKIEYVWSP